MIANCDIILPSLLACLSSWQASWGPRCSCRCAENALAAVAAPVVCSVRQCTWQPLPSSIRTQLAVEPVRLLPAMTIQQRQPGFFEKRHCIIGTFCELRVTNGNATHPVLMRSSESVLLRATTVRLCPRPCPRPSPTSCNYAHPNVPSRPSLCAIVPILNFR